MLVVYGVPNSQPVRAVLWACLLKGLPFELRLTSQNRDAKRPEFLERVNPRGTIPAIDDEGFVLWESHAILTYLAEKHRWRDLWPDDLQVRARVNQYLHFHHRNTRELVVSWSRRLWPAVFDVVEPDDEWLRRNTFTGAVDSDTIARRTLEILNDQLDATAFIAGTAAPTLADIAAYEELGQNQARFANCTDFSAYPAIGRWLDEMALLPGHDPVHEIWRLIGDVGQVEGGMATIAAANKAAASSIAEAATAIDA